MKRLFREAGVLTWLFAGAVACAVVVSVSAVAFADIFGRALSLVVAGSGLVALRQVIIIGVAVGGTFDTVAGLAKKALLRRVGTPADSQAATRMEADLLEAVNATGIGPAGLGGRTTALAVHLVTAPCHIAALPVAVNMGCCAVRSSVVEIA